MPVLQIDPRKMLNKNRIIVRPTVSRRFLGKFYFVWLDSSCFKGHYPQSCTFTYTDVRRYFEPFATQFVLASRQESIFLVGYVSSKSFQLNVCLS